MRTSPLALQFVVWLYLSSLSVAVGQRGSRALLARVDQLQGNSAASAAGDIPAQRAALLKLYDVTRGDHWQPSKHVFNNAAGAWQWSKRNTTYCRWPGVLCRSAAEQLEQASAESSAVSNTDSAASGIDVVGLLLTGAGLKGTLPSELSQLVNLQVLMLADNPGLAGAWPQDLHFAHLEYLAVGNTSLTACTTNGTISPFELRSQCSLYSDFIFLANMDSSMPGQQGVTCPKLGFAASQHSKHQLGDVVTSNPNSSNGDSSVLLRSEQQAAPPREVWWWLLHAYGEHEDGGTIVASPSFFGAAGCSCMVEGQIMIPPDESVASSRNRSDPKVGVWTCDWKDGSSPEAVKQFRQYMYIAVTASLISPGVTALIVFLIYKRLRRAYVQYKIAHSKAAIEAAPGEMTMAVKRSRFPGTPSVALAKGSGILSLSDVLVTWVVTDVEGSTQLWEWDAEVMGAAVELHNCVLRGLLEQFGGHEVRTDGDSFTLAFHDAADAVAYCVKAQEQLLGVTWPPKLLEHPYCKPVNLGAACVASNHLDQETVQPVKSGKQLKHQGMLLMAGLRVRMGINTGVPDDIFVHDLTEHVEYRGEEYALTDDIAGIAAGGQILMGPKTFQRWNRVFSQATAGVQPAGDTMQELPGDGSCIEVRINGNVQGGRYAGTLLHLPSPDYHVYHGQERHTLKQGTGSFLQRGLDMVANAFTAQIWRRQSDVEDHNGSVEASRIASWTRGNGAHQQHKRVEGTSQNGSTMVTGGDTLLLYASLGGSTKVVTGSTDAEAAAHSEPMRSEESHPAAVNQRGNNLPVVLQAAGNNALQQASGDTSAVAEPPPTVEAAPAAAVLLAGSACKASRWPAAAAAAIAAARASSTDGDNSSSQEYRHMSANGSVRSVVASHKLKKPSVGGITFAISTGPSSAETAANTRGNLDSSGRQMNATAHATGTGNGAFSSMFQRRVSLTKRMESSIEAARISPEGTRQNTKEEDTHAVRYSTGSAAAGLPSSNCPPASVSTKSRGPSAMDAQHWLPPSGRPVAEGVEHSMGSNSILAAQQQAQEAINTSLNSAEVCNGDEHSAGNSYALQNGAGPVAEAKELSGAGGVESTPQPPVFEAGRGFSGFLVASSGPSLSTPYAAGLGNIRAWLGSAAGRISRRATLINDHFLHIDENKSSGRSTISLLGYIGRFASAAGTALKGSKKSTQDGYTDETIVHGMQPSILRLCSMQRRFSSPSADQQPDAFTSDAIELSTSQVVLLDLGFYQWKPGGYAQAVDTSGLDAVAAAAAKAAARQEALATAAEGGLLHLVQVQSKPLAPRMLMFDWPLKACEGEDALMQQLLPGFLDAPGASSLMFPAQRELLEELGVQPPAKPEVALAFVAPAGIREVQAALGVKVAQACQALFTSIVREVLLAVGGYESKEVDGQVMAAFHGPRQAVEWALALQCALLQAAWPSQLAQLKSTASVRLQTATQAAGHATPCGSATASDPSPQHHAGSTGTMPMVAASSDDTFYSPSNVFKGVRARVGIWSGPMDRVLPHGKSGRADYLGPPANRAARMMGAAQGGQVLVEESIMQAVLDEWQEMEQQAQQQGLETPVAASAGDKPSAATTTSGASLPASSCVSSYCTLERRSQHRARKQISMATSGTGFSNVFDNALYGSSPSLLSPMPVKTVTLRPVAPWEADTVPSRSAATSSRMTMVSADPPTGLDTSTGVLGKPEHVLTIIPAAYQPLTKRRATQENTSYLQSDGTSGGRTSSSAGSRHTAAPSATSDMLAMTPLRHSFTLTVSSTGVPANSPDILPQQQVQLSEVARAGGCTPLCQQASGQRSNRWLSIGYRSVDVSELSRAVAAASGTFQPSATSQKVRRCLDLQPQPCQQDDQQNTCSCSGLSQQSSSQDQRQVTAALGLATPPTVYPSALYVSTANTPTRVQQQQLGQPLVSPVVNSALYSRSTTSKQQPQKMDGEVLMAAMEQGMADTASQIAQAELDALQHEQGPGHPASYLARLLPPPAFLKAPAELLLGDGTGPDVANSTADGCSAMPQPGRSLDADELPQDPPPTSAMTTREAQATMPDQYMSMQTPSSDETSAKALSGSSAQDDHSHAIAGKKGASPAGADSADSSAAGTEMADSAGQFQSSPLLSPIVRRRSQLSIVVDNPAAAPPQAADASTICSRTIQDTDVEQALTPAAVYTGLLAPSDVQLQVPGIAPGITTRPSLLPKAAGGDNMLGHSSAATTPNVSGHYQPLFTPRSSLLGAYQRASCPRSSIVLSTLSLKDSVHALVPAQGVARAKQQGRQLDLHAQQGSPELSSDSRGVGGTFADVISNDGAAGLSISSLSHCDGHSGSGSKGQHNLSSSCCTPTASSNPMLQSLAKVRVNRLLRRTDSKFNPAGSEALNATFAPMSSRVCAGTHHVWRPNSTSGNLATPKPNRRATDVSIFSNLHSSSGSWEQPDGSCSAPLPKVCFEAGTAVHVPQQPVRGRSVGAVQAVPDSRGEHMHQLQKNLTSPLPASQDGSTAHVAFTPSRLSRSNNGGRSNSGGSCQRIPERGLLGRRSSDFFEGTVQNQRMSAWQLFTAAPRSARGSGSQPGTTAAACTPISPAKRRTASTAGGTFGQARSGRQSRETADMCKATDAGVIAECFKILSGAPGDAGSHAAAESITMIKYTALKQQLTMEDTELSEAKHMVPRLAVAAAAAAAVAAASSTSSSTSGSQLVGSSSGMRSHFAHIMVQICVHRIGGFRLKGVDNIIDVVSVMPVGLEQRIQHLLPPTTLRGKSRCAVPASGLFGTGSAWLPDLSELVHWISAPMLEQQRVWEEEQQLELEVQQQQSMVQFHAQESKQQMLQQMAAAAEAANENHNKSAAAEKHPLSIAAGPAVDAQGGPVEDYQQQYCSSTLQAVASTPTTHVEPNTKVSQQEFHPTELELKRAACEASYTPAAGNTASASGDAFSIMAYHGYSYSLEDLQQQSQIAGINTQQQSQLAAILAQLQELSSRATVGQTRAHGQHIDAEGSQHSPSSATRVSLSMGIGCAPVASASAAVAGGASQEGPAVLQDEPTHFGYLAHIEHADGEDCSVDEASFGF